MKSWKSEREKVPSSSSRSPARSIALSAATLRRWKGREGIVSDPQSCPHPLAHLSRKGHRPDCAQPPPFSQAAVGRLFLFRVRLGLPAPGARRYARRSPGEPGGTRARSVLSPCCVRLAFISCGSVTDESARPAGNASCPAQPPAERSRSQEPRAPGAEL